PGSTATVFRHFHDNLGRAWLAFRNKHSIVKAEPYQAGSRREVTVANECRPPTWTRSLSFRHGSTVNKNDGWSPFLGISRIEIKSLTCNVFGWLQTEEEIVVSGSVLQAGCCRFSLDHHNCTSKGLY